MISSHSFIWYYSLIGSIKIYDLYFEAWGKVRWKWLKYWGSLGILWEENSGNPVLGRWWVLITALIEWWGDSRVLGNSNIACYNQISLNVLHSEVVRAPKHHSWTHLLPCTHVPSYSHWWRQHWNIVLHTLVFAMVGGRGGTLKDSSCTPFHSCTGGINSETFFAYLIFALKTSLGSLKCHPCSLLHSHASSWWGSQNISADNFFNNGLIFNTITLLDSSESLPQQPRPPLWDPASLALLSYSCGHAPVYCFTLSCPSSL